MPEPQPSLLLVDDDAIYRDRLARALRARGYDVQAARDGAEAMALAEADPPEFAVLDLRMPGVSGLELLQSLKRLDATTTVVMITGYGSIATALEAVRLGALTYLTKPVDADRILAALTQGAPQDLPATEESVPSLALVEWEHIQRVLADCGGNLSEASRQLGLHRRSLQRKLARRPPFK